MSKGSVLELLRGLEGGNIRIPDFVVIPHEMSIDVIEETAVGIAGSMPGPFAVRSSARGEDGVRDSFAGIFQTELGVSDEQLMDAICRVRMSLNGDSVHSYCMARNIPLLTAMDVVVQTMISADVSGVAFSRHPKGPDSLELIEAVWGLGEGLVSGEISPDQIVLLEDGSSLSYVVAHQQVAVELDDSHGTRRTWVSLLMQSARKLDDQALASVHMALKQIEDVMKRPVEIEFAIKNGQFFLLQARPITSL
jgi:phosphoenolpyruvate synthase/pyruvate phosphate dikinase